MSRIVCAVLFLFAACSITSAVCPCAPSECKCVTAPGGKDTCGSFRCPANGAKKQLTYAEVYDRVAKGETLTLAVGVSCQTADGWVASLPSIAPGVYLCYREAGANRMRLIDGCPLRRPAKPAEFRALPVGAPIVTST